MCNILSDKILIDLKIILVLLCVFQLRFNCSKFDKEANCAKKVET
uniref:Uncharacterized protein n=1 Tax=Rhizophora mucronata TaxID=61149 RepID=A0A2P2Q012_RHIMU